MFEDFKWNPLEHELKKQGTPLDEDRPLTMEQATNILGAATFVHPTDEDRALALAMELAEQQCRLNEAHDVDDRFDYDNQPDGFKTELAEDECPRQLKLFEEVD